MNQSPQQGAALVRRYIADRNSDLLVFSGLIESIPPWRSDATFTDLVNSKARRSANVSVFLTTPGGDADAAYRIIRCLQKSYKRVRLLIAGQCKSAGTLIALGADELAFGPNGELGPLDVQVSKPDEVASFGSGLDIFQALNLVTGNAIDKFEGYMDQLLSGPLSSMSTKMASQIAVQLVTGLFQPIAAQIDPLRLGETQRAINIAREYGKRVARNLRPDALDRLIERYPSHPFVIDKDECKKLFVKIDDFGGRELDLMKLLIGFVRYPTAFSQPPVIMDVGERYKKEVSDGTRKKPGRRAKNSAPNGGRAARNSRATKVVTSGDGRKRRAPILEGRANGATASK